MKKLFAFFAFFVAMFSLTSCGAKVDEEAKAAHQAFVETANDSVVTVTGYVAAKQSWWNNKGTIYLLDANSEGYFIYELSCTEEQYNTDLAIGNKISVTGVKGEWAGEVEILGQAGEGATYKVLEGTKTNFTPISLTIAEITTAHINSYFTVKNVEVVAAPTFKNAEEKSGDIYFTVKDSEGKTMDCCVESYLTSESTELYKTIAAYKGGEKINVTGYMYWYNGANPHIVSVK